LRRLLRAKDRMDAASHEDWPVQRLARVSRVSEAHFARSFKQAFGLPPHRYLLTRRIERATALLRDTDRLITEIAFDTGWRSLGTLGRTFRDVTGESPGASRGAPQFSHSSFMPAKSSSSSRITVALAVFSRELQAAGPVPETKTRPAALTA